MATASKKVHCKQDTQEQLCHFIIGKTHLNVSLHMRDITQKADIVLTVRLTSDVDD